MSAKEYVAMGALAAVRLVLLFVAVALLTATYVLLWRDMRYVARAVNAWVDRVHR